MGQSQSSGDSSPPQPPDVARTYFTGMAECADQEVMVGVQLTPRDPSNDTTGISMAAICQNADGIKRTVTKFTGPKTYSASSRRLYQTEQSCPAGRYYGAGVGMADFGGQGFGPTLRCGAATAISPDPAPNMVYVMRQFNAQADAKPAGPPPALVFTANPGAAGATQRYNDAVAMAKANA